MVGSIRVAVVWSSAAASSRRPVADSARPLVMANKASSRARVRVRRFSPICWRSRADGGGQGGGGQAGVEGVEGVVSAAQPPHRAAQRLDERGVFAFDVAGDQGAHPEPDQPDRRGVW